MQSLTFLQPAILLIALAVAVTDARPVNGGQPDYTALVDLLGDTRFIERENAASILTKAGLPAQQALMDGMKNADAEVRFRCQRILATILENDFRRRLKAFAEESDLDQNYGLSGWERFREVVGSDAGARRLFVKMHDSESRFLTITDEGPKRATEAFNLRCLELQQSLKHRRKPNQEIDEGSVAALLFVGSQAEISISNQMGSVLTSFCYQGKVQAAMSSGSTLASMKRLMGLWIERPNPPAAYQNLMLAMKYNLTEGLQPAQSVLTGGTVQAPHVRQYAILAIAKLGNEIHIPLLEPLLKDSTLCASRTVNRVAFRTEIRDVALAAVMHLSGHDPEKNGFAGLQKNDQMLFNPSTLGFEDNEKRGVAMQQWKTLQEERGANVQ